MNRRQTLAERRIARSNLDWARFASGASAVLISGTVASATKSCDGGCGSSLRLGDVAYRVLTQEGEKKYLCQKCAKEFTEQRSAYKFEEQAKIRAQMQKDFEKAHGAYP